MISKPSLNLVTEVLSLYKPELFKIPFEASSSVTLSHTMCLMYLLGTAWGAPQPSSCCLVLSAWRMLRFWKCIMTAAVLLLPHLEYPMCPHIWDGLPLLRFYIPKKAPVYIADVYFQMFTKNQLEITIILIFWWNNTHVLGIQGPGQTCKVWK